MDGLTWDSSVSTAPWRNPTAAGRPPRDGGKAGLMGRDVPQTRRGSGDPAALSLTLGKPDVFLQDL